jgi:uncharacterized protein YukE|uniref:Uncharacterized protein n=1 Tax=Podoviridae sp. ctnuR9 TaxID=2825276 RepID=A0A8S5UFV2_9CAUD|nr:MAG TPA: hypothetical protein [Podoviridae sp. ctnuR9]
MAGKAVSYQFLDALAKSIGMDAETVKQALAEINQLQTQTQSLELAVQGKAPTNHASQQPIFGTANAQMYGHVKIAREVANDSTDGVAVSPDAVYAYAPAKGMAIELPVDGEQLLTALQPDEGGGSATIEKNGTGIVCMTKNKALAVTGWISYTFDYQGSADISNLARWSNFAGIEIPVIVYLVSYEDNLVTVWPSAISSDLIATLPSNTLIGSGRVIVAIAPGIMPSFIKE